MGHDMKPSSNIPGDQIIRSVVEGQVRVRTYTDHFSFDVCIVPLELARIIEEADAGRMPTRQDK